MIEDKDLHDAIDRIARTADGRILYLFLQKRLMGVCMSEVPGALRADHGERSFAAKLIGLMAQGIADSGGRADSSTSGGSTGSGDQPLVFAVPKPVRVSGASGASRRRVTGSTIVHGYNDDRTGG